MNIREKINANPVVTTSIAIGVVVLLVVWILWGMFAGRPAVGPTKPPGQFYFTVDNGRTFFAADRGKIPPFMHEGKVAVRAHVYESGGQMFVAYMSRFPEKARATLQGISDKRARGEKVDGSEEMSIAEGAKEVALPGDAPKWLRFDAEAYGDVMVPKRGGQVVTTPERYPK